MAVMKVKSLSQHTLSRRRFLSSSAAAGLGAGSLCLSGCTTNPAPGRESVTGCYSIDDDIRLGQREYPNLIRAFGGAYDSIPLQSYVSRIGRDLASRSELPDVPWEFTVLNSPIVNALALPGGKIAITRGLLAVASNEAEVAGVLAHEIGHVTARHTAQRQTQSLLANLGLAVLGIATQNSQVAQLGQTVAAGYLQGYSRDQEFESDTLGVRYLSRAGYDPEAMATFLASLREHSQLEARLQGLAPGAVDQRNMMASHPRTIERVRRAQEAADTAPAPNARLERETYLNAINGIIFADDPDQGYVRNQDFLHAGLQFAFRVPSGFLLRNGNRQVVAEERNGGLIVFDSARAEQSQNLLDYIQYEWTEGVTLSGLETFTVNGLQAVTGIGRLNTARGAVDMRAVAYVWNGNQLYRHLFLTPANQQNRYTQGIRDTIYSFRRLSDEEAAGLNPLRIIIAPATDRDTIEALARPLPYGTLNGDWFRMLNDLTPGASLPVGQALKIVAA